jgi:calcium permeable stress-gated cation channel
MAGNSQQLYTTAIVYGTLFFCLVLSYCIAKNLFPRAFNPRNFIPVLRCDLAARRFGALNWILGVCKFSDRELCEQCGLDALVFIRILQLGFKISVMGCLNAVYLIPVYFYAQKTDDNSGVIDDLDKCSIGNMNRGDSRMYGTVVASYLIFGTTMYLVVREFEWYITARHEFMRSFSPQNYTVFVGGIHKELRSSKVLLNLFNDLFGDVHDVQIALDITELDGLMKKRETIELKFDHAISVLTATDNRPTFSRIPCRDPLDSIDAFTQQLSDVNAALSAAIAHLERQCIRHEAVLAGIRPPPPHPDSPAPRRILPMLPSPVVRDGAFITFRSLHSAAAAQQTLHHAAPYGLWVVSAPAPMQIRWGNVGLPHAATQLGSLLSGALTGTLCLLWTVPVAVVASFSRVGSLKRTFPFLEAVSEAHPLLDDVLAQVTRTAWR